MLPVSICVAFRSYTSYFIALKLGGIARDAMFVKYPVNIAGKDDELIPSSFVFSSGSIYLFVGVCAGVCRLEHTQLSQEIQKQAVRLTEHEREGHT